MSQPQNPRAVSAVALAQYNLKINFTNGEVKIFEMEQYLSFGVFEELKNLNYFNKVKIENGTVTWPNEQDICPDTLYMDSKIAI